MQYRVLENVDSDGKRYRRGDIVVMSQREAKTLLELKVIEPAYKPLQLGNISISIPLNQRG